jgi:aminoglycoside phosphotransferase (APT) family kinase protein
MKAGAITQSESLLSFRPAARRSMFYPKSDSPLSDRELGAIRHWAPDLARKRTGEVAAAAAAYGFPGSAELLSVGTYHAVHRINRVDGPPVVVRHTLPGLIEQDRGLLLDDWAHRWLAEADADILVPKVHLVRFQSGGAPFDLAIIELARGTPLRDLGDALLDDNPDVVAAIGAALRRTHAVEGSGAGLIDVMDDEPSRRPRGVHQDFAAYIDVCLREHIAACVQAEFVDSGLAGKIEQLFSSMRPALSGRPTRLLHGDPGIHNICWDPHSKSVTALIDWEDALVGDPLFDVAIWSTFHPLRRLGPFLSGYGLSSPTREEQQLIALYFLRIALSKTVHRLRFGMVDQPGRTPGHHRIHRGVEELEQLL